MRTAPFIFAAVLSFALVGCETTAQRAMRTMRPLDDLPGDHMEALHSANGGIYQAHYEGSAPLQLFQDHRAFRVGDVLTVQIVQQAAASKSASQNIDRKDDVENNVSEFFGFPLQFGHSSKTTKFTPNLTVSTKNTLDGKGATGQTDSFSTTLSAIVTRIRPNGDLVLQGENRVQLVGGDEFIRIAGVVRPDDVSSDNVVLSSRMAEARMQFSGDGETYMAPKMGLLQKIFLTVATGALLPF